MISIIRIFFLSLILALSSCSGNDFYIEFDLPADVTANYKVSYYASDKRGGMMIETAAPVVNGKFVLKGQTINPALLYLSGSDHRSIAIYVERGEKLKISGESANPYSWMIKGNETDELWSLWRNENMETLSLDDPQKTNLAVAKYVIHNPESPLSALILLTSFSRKDDEAMFRSLWLRLAGDARDPKWTSLAGRADQPDNFVRTPGILRSMAVRSFHHGIDTIRPDSAVASILFFWHAGSAARKEYIDSIKTLAKEYPDSATRIIADICLDADSIAWRSPLRSDSLENVVRAWAPAGLADSKIMGLCVPRTPFFIVFSPDGVQQYRGSDTKEAFAAFRSLAKKNTKQ